MTVLDSEIDASSTADPRPINSSRLVVKRSYVIGSGTDASGMRILRSGEVKHDTTWREAP